MNKYVYFLIYYKNKIKSHKISNNLDYLIVSHFLNIDQTGKDTDFYCGKIPDIIEEIIELGFVVKPIFVNGKWFEVDTILDLEKAKTMFQ